MGAGASSIRFKMLYYPVAAAVILGYTLITHCGTDRRHIPGITEKNGSQYGANSLFKYLLEQVAHFLLKIVNKIERRLQEEWVF